MAEPAPILEMRDLARRQQSLLDDHAHTLPTGLAVELYEIAMRLHEKAPQWLSQSKPPELDSWMVDGVTWHRELDLGREPPTPVDWEMVFEMERRVERAKRASIGRRA
jgi:hypothetical protein